MGAMMFGKHVTSHHPRVPGSEPARRLDEGQARRLEHGAADDPGEDGRDRDPDRDHRVRSRRAEEAGDDDCEHKAREREEDVDDAHQQRVGDAPPVAAEEPDRRAEHEGDPHRGHRHLQRHLGAVDDPRERVATELVRAERMRPRRPDERRVGRRVRIECPYVRAEQGDEDREADDAGADEAERVPPTVGERGPAARHREPRARNAGGLVRRREPEVGRLADQVMRLGKVVRLRHEGEIRGSITP